jgi:hypothetical protein
VTCAATTWHNTIAAPKIAARRFQLVKDFMVQFLLTCISDSPFA